MKKLATLALTLVMLLSVGVSAFATEAPKIASEKGFSSHYNNGHMIVTPSDGEFIVRHRPVVEPSVSVQGIYSYTVEQTSRGLFTGFHPITNWARGPAVITYTAQYGTMVTFEVSSTVSAGVEVPTATLSAELGTSIGGSTSITAAESVQYDVPIGWKGRIAVYYEQDILNFNWEKKLFGLTMSSGSGTAFGAAKNPFYGRQLVVA